MFKILSVNHNRRISTRFFFREFRKNRDSFQKLVPVNKFLSSIPNLVPDFWENSSIVAGKLKNSEMLLVNQLH